jgi:hypothetical protein
MSIGDGVEINHSEADATLLENSLQNNTAKERRKSPKFINTN